MYHIWLPRLLCWKGGVRHLLHNVNQTGDDGDALVAEQLQQHQHQHQQLAIDTNERRTSSASYKHNEYFNGEYRQVGYLPMVFLLHGFGANARTMTNYIPLADRHGFVLIFPEGIDESFNAGDCCGYALEKNVDDVGFLSLLQQTLTTEFPFVRSDLSYGIGHNNGAFLLTHALERDGNMFRAIVPTAGYTHQVDLIQDHLSGSTPSAKGIGLMMHHSLDDSFVLASGCCASDNSNETAAAKCYPGVNSDTCVSVLQLFDSWAREVNRCGDDDDFNFDTSSGFTGSFIGHVVGGSGRLSYSLSHQSNSKTTVLSMTPDIDKPETFTTLFESNLPLSISYKSPDNEAVCVTAASHSCIANSTLCLYRHREDFHSVDFGEQVMEFIKRNALGAVGEDNDTTREVVSAVTDYTTARSSIDDSSEMSDSIPIDYSHAAHTKNDYIIVGCVVLVLLAVSAIPGMLYLRRSRKQMTNTAYKRRSSMESGPDDIELSQVNGLLLSGYSTNSSI